MKIEILFILFNAPLKINVISKLMVSDVGSHLFFYEGLQTIICPSRWEQFEMIVDSLVSKMCKSHWIAI